ncbi:MAG: class I SAM-dependent methyltransferase [Bacillaceae bacterium]|nr:class I SAM-dependent methyltransferase [Bacillaceae bacterium]
MSKYFFEAFENLNRLAPGSETSTNKAISMLDVDVKDNLRILDIGCGTGSHTMILAEMFPAAHITAIDTHEGFLNVLKKKVVKKHLENRVAVRNVSMFELDFPLEHFDLIWAEGTIYIAGFQNGLRDWKKYLKPGGYLVCSEISWLKNNPSLECKTFWETAYQEMDTIVNKITQVEQNNYHYQFSFVLPKEDWTVQYYGPLEANLKKMVQKYPQNEDALKVVQMLREEIELYDKHSDDYSYVFYGMRKE